MKSFDVGKYGSNKLVQVTVVSTCFVHGVHDVQLSFGINGKYTLGWDPYSAVTDYIALPVPKADNRER